ncbi:MAG: putative entry exclusion protein TrbK-alt [Rhodopseudomonas palustris]|uniref:Entry exclusion protein TrbK-alt n=1 Tax=Rhodopseudomonas palustris TaxID=1076 RepID=A0A933RV30_RHOPL|nr:putative entry exclusion protein TrbK-alt [Rhodopseudomonas palustris]
MRARSIAEYVLPVLAATVMVLVVAACAIQLRTDEGLAPIASPAAEEPDPFAAKLFRCRTVTIEQPTELAECRRVWAESRRRFLKQPVPHAETPEDKPGAGAEPKIQDRLPKPLLQPQQSEDR